MISINIKTTIVVSNYEMFDADRLQIKVTKYRYNTLLY